MEAFGAFEKLESIHDARADHMSRGEACGRSTFALKHNDSQCGDTQHLPVVPPVADASASLRPQLLHKGSLDRFLLFVPDYGQTARKVLKLYSGRTKGVSRNDVDIENSRQGAYFLANS